MSDVIIWIIIAAVVGAASMGTFGPAVQSVAIGFVALSIFALALGG